MFVHISFISLTWSLCRLWLATALTDFSDSDQNTTIAQIVNNFKRKPNNYFLQYFRDRLATKEDVFNICISPTITNIILETLSNSPHKRIGVIGNSINCGNITVISRHLQDVKEHVHVHCINNKDNMADVLEEVSIVYSIHDIRSFGVELLISFLTQEENLLFMQVETFYALNSDWLFCNMDMGMLKTNTLRYTNIVINSHSSKRLLNSSVVMSTNIQLNDSSSNNSTTPFIRFASVLYPPLLFELHHQEYSEGRCELGVVCKIPKQHHQQTQWVYSCCAGLIMDYFEILRHDMKKKQGIEFDYEISIVEDGTFGGFVNGSWTGVIKDVYNGKADIGLQAITILQQRLEFVDFTEPILVSNLAIARRVKEPSLKVINWVFLNKIELGLCIVVVITFVSCMIMIFVCENISLHLTKQPRYETREIFTYLSGLLFQRDIGGKNLKRWPSRLPSITFAVAMTIIMSTYTADLTANNIVYDDSDDFQGFGDRKITNPNENFKFGIMNNTSFQYYFMQKPVTYRFLKNYLVLNDIVGLSRLRDGLMVICLFHILFANIPSRDGDTLDGYIADYTWLKHLIARPQFCSKITIYKETGVPVFSSFPVKKNSKWKKVFSRSIFNVQESGKFDELMKKWILLADCRVNSNEAQSFTWRYFGALLLVTGAFITLSIVILVIENCFQQITKVRQNEIQSASKNH